MNASSKTLKYLGDFSKEMIEGSRSKTTTGVNLYTPDGVSSYNALWLRDFSYMVEYAGEYIPEKDIIDCINYAISGKREDGWMPDRIYGDGTVAYAAGECGKPIGQANLDNTPFLVFTVFSLSCRLSREEFYSLYAKWESVLNKGMKIIPLAENGLVFNTNEAPHSPYGFTDTVAKTGFLFMESLLFWRACRFMHELGSKFNGSETEWYAEQSKKIEDNIDILTDPATGIYFAASDACRQLDIWGNAYMLYIGFPCNETKRHSILDFLTKNYGQYVYKGQIRHLLKEEYWERLLINIKEEEYQNGAYWATASGWVIWCLAQTDTSLACEALFEVVDYFKTDGAYECVNGLYKKLPSFVVSATNVYGGLLRLLKSETLNFAELYDNYKQVE